MCDFKIGDVVEVISTNTQPFFKEGDIATLTHQDKDGDWWGDFEHYGPSEDRNWCLQNDITVFKHISCDDACDFQKILMLTDEYIAARLAFNDGIDSIGKITDTMMNLNRHIAYLQKTYTKKLGPGCL